MQKHKAYYNEIDTKACNWMQCLMDQGLIMAGKIDNRSIYDVKPDDLKQFTRVGFFAGIAGWDYALQLAGWPEDKPVWHGSCPCQPFSTAGNQKGQQDERHLWPAFFNLIRECRPQHVFGEQVANAIGHGWLDGISADLEAEDYACGAAVLGAHSVGAPHIRQRLYWVANNNNKYERPAGQHTTGVADVAGCGEADGVAVTRHLCRGNGAVTGRPELNETSRCCEESCGLDNSELPGLEGLSQPRGFGQSDGRGERITESAKTGGQVYHTLAHSDDGGFSQFTKLNSEQKEHPAVRYPQGRHIDGCSNFSGMGNNNNKGLEIRQENKQRADQDTTIESPSAWVESEHAECRDGKVRRIPTEPAFFPLAHGVQGRVGLLRGYGNAIVPQTAAVFIQASFEAINDPLLGVW